LVQIEFLIVFIRFRVFLRTMSCRNICMYCDGWTTYRFVFLLLYSSRTMIYTPSVRIPSPLEFKEPFVFLLSWTLW
jgi:hypothetical protein